MSLSLEDHCTLACLVFLISKSDAKNWSTDCLISSPLQASHQGSRGNIQRNPPDLSGDIFTPIHVINLHTNRGYLGF